MLLSNLVSDNDIALQVLDWLCISNSNTLDSQTMQQPKQFKLQVSRVKVLKCVELSALYNFSMPDLSQSP